PFRVRRRGASAGGAGAGHRAARRQGSWHRPEREHRAPGHRAARRPAGDVLPGTKRAGRAAPSASGPRAHHPRRPAGRGRPSRRAARLRECAAGRPRGGKTGGRRRFRRGLRPNRPRPRGPVRQARSRARRTGPMSEPVDDPAEAPSAPAGRNLDPDDWQAFRALSHQALDAMIDHIATLEDRPVWQPAPEATRRRFHEPLPRAGRPLADVLDDFARHIGPYATGNGHPLFMGWVHGAGTPVGMLAEMLAAGLNANCGGRNHIGLDVERQVARWFAQLFGYPDAASGIFVTGTSMANFLGLLVARSEVLGAGIRAEGLRAAPAQLTAYASTEAHGCIAQALELAGIGSRNLRQVPVDAEGAMRIDALAAAIAADRQRGARPFLVVGSAGTVNTGAIDPLDRIADVARAEGVWFHVDGAFGALAALSERLRPLLAGIERSQSVAFDLHKWAHVPYDAGFLLVRDGEAHRRAFASPAAYLQRTPRGL